MASVGTIATVSIDQLTERLRYTKEYGTRFMASEGVRGEIIDETECEGDAQEVIGQLMDDD